MQFIDFKEEHFTQNEETGDYSIIISKDEIGYSEIEILEKQDDNHYSKAEYELEDSVENVTIKMKKPGEIRVNF
jgi:hypothetical protein